MLGRPADHSSLQVKFRLRYQLRPESTDHLGSDYTSAACPGTCSAELSPGGEWSHSVIAFLPAPSPTPTLVPEGLQEAPPVLSVEKGSETQVGIWPHDYTASSSGRTGSQYLHVQSRVLSSQREEFKAEAGLIQKRDRVNVHSRVGVIWVRRRQAFWEFPSASTWRLAATSQRQLLPPNKHPCIIGKVGVLD